MLFVARLRCAAAMWLIAVAMNAVSADNQQILPGIPIQSPPQYLSPKPGDGAFKLPPLETAPSSTDKREIFVNQIIIRGNKVLPAGELDEIAAPYRGRRLTVADIEELRRKLTEHYISRGFINSGALVAKDDDATKAGVITFDIVEGKVSQFQINGLQRLSESYVTGRLVRKADEPLNLNVLRERFQLLLDDPLFARINLRIIPDVNLGEAILDLDVTRARPYQLTTFINNYRPPSIGEGAFGFNGTIRNITGYGDLLELGLQDPVSGEKPHNQYHLGWRFPVGPYGTAITARKDYGQSIVTETSLAALNIVNVTDSVDFGISHPIVETLRHKLTLGFNDVQQTITSTLLGQPFSFTAGVPSGQTQAHVQRWWQEYSYRSERNALVLRSTFSSENNNNVVDPGNIISEPPQSYHYWIGQFQFAQKIGERGLQAVIKGAAQRADTMLLPIDQFSIGGVNTVRGYRENQLLTDKGQLSSIQLDIPTTPLGKELPQITLSPFFDWGRGNVNGEPSTILSSIGLAMKASWKGFRLDLAIAKRLIHPSSLDDLSGSLQDKKTHIQLSYDAF